MSRSRRWLALAVLSLSMAAPGCTRWGSHSIPEPSSTRRLPDPVRVTRADGSRMVLVDPAVSGDSLVGSDRERNRAAVALRDVRTMHVRRNDYPRTVGLTAVITLAAVIAVFLVAAPPPGPS